MPIYKKPREYVIDQNDDKIYFDKEPEPIPEKPIRSKKEEANDILTTELAKMSYHYLQYSLDGRIDKFVLIRNVIIKMLELEARI